MSAQIGRRATLWVVLLGATAIAFAPIFAVLAHRAEPLAPTVTAFWRTALASPVLVLLAWRASRRGAPRTTATGLRWLALPGLFFAIDLSCWHTSMTHISAGLATVLGNLSVVIVPCAAWLLFREKYGLKYAPATALALLGAALVCLPPGERVLQSLQLPASNYSLGNALAGSTAFAYAGYQLAIKRARRVADTWLVMACSSVTTALLLLAYNLLMGFVLWPRQLEAWSSLLALALVSHCLGQGIIAWSLGKLPAYRVALLLLWQPACSAALSVGLLRQSMSGLQWTGTAIVLLALAAANWPQTIVPKRQKMPKPKQNVPI